MGLRSPQEDKQQLLLRQEIHVKKCEIIPKDFENLTYKCLNFLTYTKISHSYPKNWEKFQIYILQILENFSHLNPNLENFLLLYL